MDLRRRAPRAATPARAGAPGPAPARGRLPGRLLGPLVVVAGNPDLAGLAGAFAAVTLAEWGYVTALAIVALRLGGATAVGLVGLRLFFAAGGSLAGARLTARRPGARVMTAVAAGRGAVVAASAVVVGSGAGRGPLAALLVLVALDAVVSSFYRPAQSSVLPVLARTSTEVSAAPAALSTVKTLAQAVGAVVGSSLLTVTSPTVVFAGAAVVFAAAAAATWRFRGSGPGPAVRAGLVTRVRDILAVGVDRTLGPLVAMSGLRTLVRGMWTVLAVLVSFRLLHAGSPGVGLLMLGGGVGALVAVPLSAALVERSRLGRPASAAFLLCGLPLGVIAGVPVIDAAVALVAAWGVGMAVADVATSSLVFRLLPAPQLPRATAAIESAKLASEGIGALLAPLLVDAVGIRSTLVVAALPLPLLVVAGRRALRQTDAAAGERAGLLRLLHGVACLAPLDAAGLESVATRVTPLVVAPGTDIVTQGDPGDRFYVVESGTVDVLVDGFRVSVLGPGQGFGERALLRDVARTATVRARQAVRLVCLGRDDFLAAVTGDAAGGVAAPAVGGGGGTRTRRYRVDALASLSSLAHLDPAALAALAETAVLDRWPAGATIVRRGEPGERVYVLLAGRAEVAAPDGRTVPLAPGDGFGDIAVLHGVARTADVVATEEAVTLSLHRDDFVPAARARLGPG